MLSYSIGPLLGDVESRGVDAMTTVRVSVVSGGVLCIAGTVLSALTLRKFISYDVSRRSAPDQTLRDNAPICFSFVLQRKFHVAGVQCSPRRRIGLVTPRATRGTKT